MDRKTLCKRILGHVGTGAAIGYLILHPASIWIYSLSDRIPASLSASPLSAFDLGHIRMAVFFALIGSTFGLLNGLNAQRQAVLHEKVRKLSITDDLTGLHNRRQLMQAMENEFERAKRYGYDLSLLLLNIDHFKQYNDRNGHPAGDRLLQQFAARLRAMARKTDTVARYGGEEFCVVMPQTRFEEALGLAERIRKDIENLPFDFQEYQPGNNITVSIGCAHWKPGSPSDVWDLFKTADDRLYRAKREGRNRISG